MKRLTGFLCLVAAELIVFAVPLTASPFTPLEWQQVIRKETIPGVLGQRKNNTWVRDRNRNFIDDEIERRFRPGDRVNVIIDLNTCLTPRESRALLARFGRISYVGKLITYVMLEKVRFEDLRYLAAHPRIAMVEWQTQYQFMNDVSTRAIQARSSITYSLNTAQDAGYIGTGVNIAILDTGVDNNHEAFTGKSVAGFDATIFSDTNGNSIDDSCEGSPWGNGICTDADDEPANGTKDPPAGSHGTHVAGIALGNATTGRVCSTVNDFSPTNCGGVALGSGLIDVRLGGSSIVPADISEALDWIAINRQLFNIRSANLSIGNCLNDDGTSAISQQVNYVVAQGTLIAVSHGNASGCSLSPGAVITQSPGSASLAITVGGTNDWDTVSRVNDTNFSGFLRGPRMDFNSASPNRLALKPDISAPGQNIVAASSGTISSYVSKSGTSMAAPHVAGGAAIVVQARPGIDPGSLKDLLKRSADTTHNVAQFPSVDAVWDTDLGAGMLNLWPAVTAAASTDMKFPDCVGPGWAPGQPCALTSNPSWANMVDINTTTAPQVGVANTIVAQVRNNGPAPATVLVNFGVYVFGVGNNQFFHVGTQQVTVPATTTVSVNQPWTPAFSNHQCAQVVIDYGFDTDYGNNVTQRNFQVAPSVYEVRIENPFMVPAKFQIQAKSDRDGWICSVSEESFNLDPFQDCPRNLKVTFNAPRGTKPGERANCNVGVLATPRGAERPTLIGGVTVQTFVPRRCPTKGVVVDTRGRPVGGARLQFSTEPEGVSHDTMRGRTGTETTASTDVNGTFSAMLPAEVNHFVIVTKSGLGRGQAVLHPTCDGPLLRYELSREGLKRVK